MLLREGAYERTFKMAHRLTLFSFWAGVGSRSRLRGTGPSALHAIATDVNSISCGESQLCVNLSITNAIFGVDGFVLLLPLSVWSSSRDGFFLQCMQ